MSMKSDAEVEVLKSFLNICPDFLKKTAVIEPCNPPEPDCRVSFSDGTRIFFELRRVADPVMEQKINDKKIPNDEKGGFGPDDDLIAECAKDKIVKSELYKTNGLDLDLVLYFDLLPSLLLPKDVIEHYLHAVIATHGKGSFRKIWIFAPHEKKIVGCF